LRKARLYWDDEFGKLIERFGAQRAALGFEEGAEACQDGGVDAVGLGARAGRLGEAAGMEWIDLCECHAEDAEAALERAVIGSGRLEHNPLDAGAIEPAQQGVMAGTIIAEPPRVAAGVKGGIEMVFGSPTSSLFLVSTEIAGSPAAKAVVTWALM
jgi:hypothetical protein